MHAKQVAYKVNTPKDRRNDFRRQSHWRI